VLAPPVRRRLPRAAAAIIAVGIIAVSVLASASPVLQRSGGRNRAPSALGTPWIYDGAFVFCRLAFRESFDGDGSSWSVDYPKADLNFPFRLGELTETPISHDFKGDPYHVIVTPTDPHLFQCPLIMMTEVWSAFFGPDDAKKLREYLDKGGFIWADDFWGEYAWAIWEREIRKVLPAGEFPIRDLPPDHSIFNISYLIRRIPQIPSIDFWFGSGFQTSERYDSRVPHVRAIENARGDVILVMTHNTDFGDAFEREGEDRRYFDTFAAEGYAFGVNVFLYAMTH
jgi:hypothetical protein